MASRRQGVKDSLGTDMALSSESSLVCLVPNGALGGATEVTLSSVRTKCQGDLGTGQGYDRGSQGGV